MQLAKIQTGIEAYAAWLGKQRAHPYLYQWETIQHFQQHWNTDTDAPAVMYEQCLYNSDNRRLWQDTRWEPKRMMTLLWQYDPLSVRMMFDDLFNATKEEEGRISRFLFGCDTLLRDYKKDHPVSVENNHYHGDFRMIALYLTCRYPDQYAFYQFPIFSETMRKIGAREVPQENDLVRYFKVLRTLDNFIQKKPEIGAAFERMLHSKKHFTGKTLLVAADFCRFMAE